jgi:hypothetical protein
MWPLPYLLAVAFLFAPGLLVLLFLVSMLEGRLLAEREPVATEQPEGAPAGTGTGPRPA